MIKQTDEIKKMSSDVEVVKMLACAIIKQAVIDAKSSIPVALDCKKEDIKGYSTMTKEDLSKKIVTKQIDNLKTVREAIDNKIDGILFIKGNRLSKYITEFKLDLNVDYVRKSLKY